jgi:hypothetical protein
MATFRKSTLVIVAVRSANHENERCPSLETQQAPRPQTQEEMLPQQAALQTLSRRCARPAQGRTQWHSGKDLVKVFKRARQDRRT